jgi:DNA repair protein SbcC/Rad50
MKSIQLENFQSHRQTEINLSPGVNVIVGPSDSGKSAIIRALNWVVSNRPSGDAFRSDWGGDTFVRIDSVIREKGKHNGYWIGDQQFSAIGASVPEEVTKALNLQPINFQFQHDSPFLLTLSPGETGKYLNQIADLERIDQSISHANSRVRSINGEIQQTEKRITEIETELSSTEWAEKIEPSVTEIEKKQETLLKLSKQAEDLKTTLGLIETIEERINRFKPLENASKQVSGLIRRNAELQQKRKQAEQLRILLSTVETRSEQLENAKTLLAAEPAVVELDRKGAEVKELEQKAAALEILLAKIDGTKQTIESIAKFLQESITVFEEQMGDTCLLCGAER